MPAEGLARGVELRAQLGEVVNLAVEDNHVAGVGRDHRLVAALGEVDDGKAREAEMRARFAPVAAVVRSAVMQAPDRIIQLRGSTASKHGAYDAAHAASPKIVASRSRATDAQVNFASARARAAVPMRC